MKSEGRQSIFTCYVGLQCVAGPPLESHQPSNEGKERFGAGRKLCCDV